MMHYIVCAVLYILFPGINASPAEPARFSLGPPNVAAPGDTPYWLADITHQGVAAFNQNPSGYKVFRNVKDYGAKGMLRVLKARVISDGDYRRRPNRRHRSHQPSNQ